jgi:hypothetical protein
MSDLFRRDFILTGSAALTSYLAKAEGTLKPLTAAEQGGATLQRRGKKLFARPTLAS